MEVFDLTRGTTTGTIRVPAKAGTSVDFKIRSTKTKKVNGKIDTTGRIEFTYDYGDQGYVRAFWETDPSNLELYIVTIKVIGDNFSASERQFTLSFTQKESGKVLNLTVIQEANITVQKYILTSSGMPRLDIPANGGIDSVQVQSYALMSDGSKNPITPTNISQPAWITKVTIVPTDISQPGFSEYIYIVTVMAEANNNANSRLGNLTLKIPASGEGVELDIPIAQDSYDHDITLGLQFNDPNVIFTSLFADGEAPISIIDNGGYEYYNVGKGSYFWTFSSGTGLLVNRSSPNHTKYAKPGDRVRVYTKKSNSPWGYIGTFTVPSTNATITL